MTTRYRILIICDITSAGERLPVLPGGLDPADFGLPTRDFDSAWHARAAASAAAVSRRLSFPEATSPVWTIVPVNVDEDHLAGRAAGECAKCGPECRCADAPRETPRCSVCECLHRMGHESVRCGEGFAFCERPRKRR